MDDPPVIMSSRDKLPIYASHPSSSTPPSSASSGTLSSYSSTAKSFIANVSESGKTLLASQRPWSEALDRNSFNWPDSFLDATGRIQKNLGYFRVNYAVLTSLIVLFGLLWHPGALIFLLCLVLAWTSLYFYRSQPFVLFNIPFSENEILLILSVFTFVVVFFTSTGSTIFTGLAMAAAVVVAHAALRSPDNLFLEEQTNVSSNHVSSQQQQQHSVFNTV